MRSAHQAGNQSVQIIFLSDERKCRQKSSTQIQPLCRRHSAIDVSSITANLVEIQSQIAEGRIKLSGPEHRMPKILRQRVRRCRKAATSPFRFIVNLVTMKSYQYETRLLRNASKYVFVP